MRVSLPTAALYYRTATLHIHRVGSLLSDL